MRGTLSSREALSLLVKRKAGFRTFGSSFAGCRALPNPLARFQVAPVVARVSGRCSLVGGGSFRTSPFPRHRALCDGSVQSCFVRPCCHGFGRLARSPPGVRWSAAANAALSAATDCSAICFGAHLRCRRYIDDEAEACAVRRVPSVRIGRLPSRCVTCRPGLSVRTVSRLCHSPRAAFLASPRVRVLVLPRQRVAAFPLRSLCVLESKGLSPGRACLAATVFTPSTV